MMWKTRLKKIVPLSGISLLLTAAPVFATVTVNVAASGNYQNNTLVTVPFTATADATDAYLDCGLTQTDLSEILDLGESNMPRWQLKSTGLTNSTVKGQLVQANTRLYSFYTSDTAHSTMSAAIWCQLKTSSGTPVSAVTPVNITIHAVPKPTLSLSAKTLDLGSCRVDHPQTLSGQFTATTAATGDFPTNTVTLKASVTGGSGTADTVKILDGNNNDIVQSPADITATANGDHPLTVSVPCPAEAGAYSWQVTVTEEIE
ncbi:hypothetical protein [Pantoea latae]|uniref:Ig-like domain-containing protein n=1 Tax=Pantoea latae TaxID=1964541 RepID=A0A1V9DPG6_9GAMM|nr:hypothetical protein [Pantoea latae]OQP35737.1 hypothetical protein B2J69_01705 [Pantoea latae]